jgi:hypothetical protein
LWESGCGTARSDLVGDGKFLDGVGLLGWSVIGSIDLVTIRGLTRFIVLCCRRLPVMRWIWQNLMCLFCCCRWRAALRLVPLQGARERRALGSRRQGIYFLLLLLRVWLSLIRFIRLSYARSYMLYAVLLGFVLQLIDLWKQYVRYSMLYGAVLTFIY